MSVYERIRRHEYPYRPLHHKLLEEWREQERVKGGLLKDPDGYYSTPIMEGMLFSPTGRMEIIGYVPQATSLTPISLHAIPAPSLRPRAPRHLAAD